MAGRAGYGGTKWNRFHALSWTMFRRQNRCRPLVESSKPTFYLQRHAPKVSTVINIDNDVSDDFSVIEIFTEDRIGVLFSITYSLHQLGLSIHVAKISTNVDQVADVFYVTDRSGEKIARCRRSRERQNLFPKLSRPEGASGNESLSSYIDSFLSMATWRRGWRKIPSRPTAAIWTGSPIFLSDKDLLLAQS